MTSPVEFQKLIHELSDSKRELDRLVFDEEYPHELSESASPQQIAALEGILRKPLPPSYRAFLGLHNGWSNFAGDAKILSVDDQEAEWVKERVKSLGFLFQEFEAEDPFTKGAIPILLGKREQSYLILDPRTVHPDGEMDFVSIHLTKEENRFKNFAEFLLHDLDLTGRLIQNEKKCISGDSAEN